jgi:hypothetical protein
MRLNPFSATLDATGRGTLFATMRLDPCKSRLPTQCVLRLCTEWMLLVESYTIAIKNAGMPDFIGIRNVFPPILFD